MPNKSPGSPQPAITSSAPQQNIDAQRRFFKSSGNNPHIVGSAQSSTTIENELYRITFSNRGGQVTNWILKKYKDRDGKPLNLVHTQAAQQFGFPLSLYTYDPALTAVLNKALYVPSVIGSLTAPARLTFTYSDGGLQVRKVFSFDEPMFSMPTSSLHATALRLDL